ncbi:DUF4006 family protein [Helicobacter sp. MIT 14-3879]|uniref:DUF4006 family protein n=1 Tax=Helicobacter sp. MIT 14-3879 TaxID=2040649 RepID=UPI000E1E437E|nr:DUF4006 family protein [Helicobacter sp. MIT 14-3879]RDU65621.1 DUF4006 domain-containing protein [Helicobacter sp. MIT 14-3879]
MNGGYFSLNGLVGFFIAVVLLLVIVAIFAFSAVGVQKREATNYYTIDTQKAVMIDTSNSKHYKAK